MKCKKCSYIMDFRNDAWPIEVSLDNWTELWVCPECGEEEVA